MKDKSLSIDNLSKSDKIGLVIRFERTFSNTVYPGDLLAIEALDRCQPRAHFDQ